jgi:hypothetical protein
MIAPRLNTVKVLAFFLLAASCIGLESSGSAYAANATQRAADRANHDRWARSEPSSSHHSSSSDDDEDEDSHHSRDKIDVPGHSGELNGHLSIKGW